MKADGVGVEAGTNHQSLPQLSSPVSVTTKSDISHLLCAHNCPAEYCHDHEHNPVFVPPLEGKYIWFGPKVCTYRQGYGRNWHKSMCTASCETPTVLVASTQSPPETTQGKSIYLKLQCSMSPTQASIHQPCLSTSWPYRPK